MAVAEPNAAAAAVVEPVAAAADGVRARVVDIVSAGQGEIDVAEADIIVTGGRGVDGPEGFAPIRSLAKTLGAAVGASRAAVDAGWIEHTHQVGQTGKTVTPNLYIACGVSGRHPAPGRYEDVQGHRRRKQRPRGPHLQDRQLWHRGRSLCGSASVGEGVPVATDGITTTAPSADLRGRASRYPHSLGGLFFRWHCLSPRIAV